MAAACKAPCFMYLQQSAEEELERRRALILAYLLDALHSGGQVHGNTGEGLRRGHLLLDALPLLHELAVAAGHLLHSIGEQGPIRKGRISTLAM